LNNRLISSQANKYFTRRFHMNVVGLIIGVLLGALIGGLIIWIVGKLGLGIEVSGFGPAFIAAIVIAILNSVVVWLLGVLNITLTGGFLSALINLVIAAVVLLLAGRFVKGLVVKGFFGAIVAAIAIAAVGWLLAWGVSLLA
jgi:putative membrane protein